MSPKTSSAAVAPVTRMGAGQRRELVLEAATRAFARSGFAGTSTDAVAREAGVSQPYVVRIFGTKLDLFLEVYTRAVGQVAAAFRAVLDDGPFDPEDEDDWGRLGSAYAGLLADRDFLLVMMHGFSAAGVPEIGAAARSCMAEIFEIVKDTGCSDEAAKDFIAQGMLMNIMLAMSAPEHLSESPALAALTECAFGDAMSAVSAATP